MFDILKSGNHARSRLLPPDSCYNEVYLSVVSLWEVILKYQLGKINFPESPDLYLPRQRKRHFINHLDLSEKSVTQLIKLPLLHRDPFERMFDYFKGAPEGIRFALRNA